MSEATAYIELDLVLQHDMTGLIVCRSSGIRWSNQACGYWCEHPSSEGIFLPLPSSCIPPDRLKDVRFIPSNEEQEEPSDKYYDKAVVGAFLEQVVKLFSGTHPAAPVLKFEPLEEWAGYSGEAWVPCRLTYVDECSPAAHLLPFVGSECIIVYENSD